MKCIAPFNFEDLSGILIVDDYLRNWPKRSPTAPAVLWNGRVCWSRMPRIVTWLRMRYPGIDGSVVGALDHLSHHGGPAGRTQGIYIADVADL